MQDIVLNPIEAEKCIHQIPQSSTHVLHAKTGRASFNIATSGVSAPVGPSSGPVVKQKNLILPQ